MLPSRDATIDKTDERVAISTFAMRPLMEALSFFVAVIPWLIFGVFGLLGIFGLISPETMSLSVRIIMAIWLVFWFVGGGFILRHQFLQAFSRLDILADSYGVSLHRRSPLGSSSKKYPWSQIDYVSEYLQEGRPYGGVVMHADGRLLTIDARLPNSVAASIAEALSAISPPEPTKG